ncbi:MAG: hypothetical protein ACKPAD_10060, partial [Bacteroidota bacterium]
LFPKICSKSSLKITSLSSKWLANCSNFPLCAALGGRAAEEVMFGQVSTGALSDLEKITKQAYAMVSIFGLNEKIGNISYYDSSGQQDYNFSKPYSEKTAQTIDEEVSKLVDACYIRTKEILAANKGKLEQLASHLLDKEVIFKEDLEQIFGKRPFEEEETVLPSEIPQSVSTDSSDDQLGNSQSTAEN